MLTKAQLQEENDSLKARIAELEASVPDISAELARYGLRIGKNGKVCEPSMYGDELRECDATCPNCGGVDSE